MKVQVLSKHEKSQKFVHRMPQRLVKRLDSIKSTRENKKNRLSRTALINSIVDSAISSPRFKLVAGK